LCREKKLSLDNSRNDFVSKDREYGTNGNDGKHHTPNQCTALVSVCIINCPFIIYGEIVTESNDCSLRRYVFF